MVWTGSLWTGHCHNQITTDQSGVFHDRVCQRLSVPSIGEVCLIASLSDMVDMKHKCLNICKVCLFCCLLPLFFAILHYVIILFCTLKNGYGVCHPNTNWKLIPQKRILIAKGSGSHCTLETLGTTNNPALLERNALVQVGMGIVWNVSIPIPVLLIDSPFRFQNCKRKRSNV